MKKATESLLALSSPCQNVQSNLSTEAEEFLQTYLSHTEVMKKIVSSTLTTLDGADAIQAVPFLSYKSYGWDSIKSGVTGFSLLTAGIGAVTDVTDVITGMARTAAWSETYISQLQYLSSIEDKKNEKVCKNIANGAADLYREYADSFRAIAAESTEALLKDTANYLSNLTPPGQVLAVYNLIVSMAENSSDTIATAFQAGDDATIAMNLIDLSGLMRNQYKTLICQLGKENVSESMIQNLRMAGSLMNSASSHSRDRMYSIKTTMNKDVSDIKGKLLKNVVDDYRYYETSQFDPSLYLQVYFANLYSTVDGAHREKIPPEYVHRIPLRVCSCIGEIDGTLYSTTQVDGKETIPKLPFQAAEYDYISSFIYFQGQVYYCCKDAGTSDYRTAIYRCNPDGSDQKKVMGNEELRSSTRFHISYGVLYPWGVDKAYDIEKGKVISQDEETLWGCVPELFNSQHVFYAESSAIKMATYDAMNPYQRKDQEVIVGNLFGSWFRLQAVTETSVYYEREYDNTSYLYRYDIESGKKICVDSHPAAGSGGYYNW